MQTTFHFDGSSVDPPSYGTVHDLDQLISGLADISAALRQSSCVSIRDMAQRSSAGRHAAPEVARPLQRCHQRLQELARSDSCAEVREAALAAANAVDAATASLPAWTVAPVAPSPSMKRPGWPGSATTPTTVPGSSGAEASEPNMAPPAAAAPGPALASIPLHSQPSTWKQILEGDSQTPSAKRGKGPSAKELGVRPCDELLFGALVTLRTNLAKGKMAYQVATNAELAAMAQSRPRSQADLYAIRGLGPTKVKDYGDAFLQCVASHAAAEGSGGMGVVASPTTASGGETPASRPALSEEQQYAITQVSNGRSIFLTGGAGTGKSFTLKTVIECLHLMHGKENVFVTASTGIAACAIGGTTVHSWGGIGLGKDSARELAEKVAGKMQIRKRWQNCRALVIDEVSMLDGSLARAQRLSNARACVRPPLRLPRRRLPSRRLRELSSTASSHARSLRSSSTWHATFGRLSLCPLLLIRQRSPLGGYSWYSRKGTP